MGMLQTFEPTRELPDSPPLRRTINSCRTVRQGIAAVPVVKLDGFEEVARADILEVEAISVGVRGLFGTPVL